jgi:hypothetical protein
VLGGFGTRTYNVPMANKKYAWQERRFKLFEKAYNTNAVFRDDLNTAYKTGGIENLISKITDIFVKHKVTIWAVPAAVEYVVNPNLKRTDYLNRITPPIYFWNAVTDKIGPHRFSEDSATIHFSKKHDFAERVLADFKQRYPNEKYESAPEFSLREIAGNTTAIHVLPYITKSELHELIDCFWEDLEPLINQKTTSSTKMDTDELLTSIQPSLTKSEAERNELILKMTEEGASANNISWELTKAGYGTFTSGNIRTIRSRLKNQHTKKKK